MNKETKNVLIILGVIILVIYIKMQYGGETIGPAEGAQAIIGGFN